MTKNQYQKLLEVTAVFYLYVIQLAASIAFINNPRSTLFERLIAETGFNYWHIIFSVACLMGILCAVLLLLLPRYKNKRHLWKRTVYILSSLPFAFYGAFSAYYLAARGVGSVLGIVILSTIYFAMWVIAGAVWRPIRYLP